MHCSILIHESPSDFGLRADADAAKRDAYWAAWPLYAKALHDAGVFCAGAGLQVPESATTVRHRNDQRQVQDGPFADTKEQLGGFFMIEVADLDAALDGAARCPRTGGWWPICRHGRTTWPRRKTRWPTPSPRRAMHARRLTVGHVDWNGIALLYEGLAQLFPTVGGLVGRAAALSDARGAEAGWTALQALDAQRVADYQPYRALAAHLLSRLDRRDAASQAYARAIGLCEDAAMRDFLIAKAAAR